jgi:CubicO group peptidase (beta-lactamase class C family)
MTDKKIGSAQIAELQALVNETASATGAIGAQVSVILGGERADFVYGDANAELNIPMTVDTVVQVGSVAKVVNAALIMSLVEERKLALDTPVIEYLPDLELGDKHARETITLRQLLSMSSGVDNAVPYVNYGMGEDVLARYVASLRKLPQVFPPGQGFGYTSAGTCIAGYAAERIAASSWDALVRKRIFEPAGLVRAVTLAEDLPFHRVSLGYTPAHDGKPAAVIRPWCLIHAQGPAGSTLAMSAHDLASFGQLFIDGGKATNGNRVLSESSVREMMTPTTEVPMPVPAWGVGSQWGLGPHKSSWGGTVVWGHAGGNGSGIAQLIWLPDKRGVLAFTVNTLAAFTGFSAQMFGAFSAAVFGASAPQLRAPESPVRVDNPERYIGTYSRTGARYEISARADRLHYAETNLGLGLPEEVLGLMVEGELVPLGQDRFLVQLPGRPDFIPIGFFGSDAQGHSTNLVNPAFASLRVK